MKRRAFFSRLSAAVAGCYLGVGLNLKGRIEREWVINPACENAEYDICFVTAIDPVKRYATPILFKRKSNA